MSAPEAIRSEAALALLLTAVDPHGIGGTILRGRPGPARDLWLSELRRLLPDDSPWRKVPVNVSDDRLLGGLDFAATVGSGKPVFATGLLEAANGGVLILSMAERLPATAAAIIGGALDSGEVLVERDGMTRRCRSRFGVVALDEGIEEDECLADGLADRIAFRITPDVGSFDDSELAEWSSTDLAAARDRLAEVVVPELVILRLCESAVAFGIPSARAELLALRAARAIAALFESDTVLDEHAALAARLVLPHRALRLPAEAPEQPEQPETPEEPEERADQRQSRDMPEDVLVDAVRAAIPDGLLEVLLNGGGRRRRSTTGGRGGPSSKSKLRGRPIGATPTDSPGSSRLNVLATLKAAVPWQTLRRQNTGRDVLEIRKQDLHVTRFKDRTETTTVFVVDASGSQAAQRLAEVKGAIELLLHDCYVRRDQVALVAFRGKDAEILLSPTRALARARRSLAELPGGGGTPLAAGLDAARELAESVERHGRVPAIVLLTDGRANITRDAEPGAERAERDAIAAAELLKLAGHRSLLVDTSRRPRPRARTLADAMGARYVPLPRADAASISETVQRGIS